ncbi:MAG TPA: Uma2 family endonuclease [Verrucomicrobiae bacterium]|nr:Uma2 family endonuclease [Verrucomicrobiae bacterium]
MLEHAAPIEAAGVKEYWLADPVSRTLEPYGLVDGRYTPIPESEGRIASAIVPGWYVRPAWLWAEPRTSELDALAELIGRAR